MASDSQLFNYRAWYNNLAVLYEMMKSSRNREIAVINPFSKSECIRMIKVNTAQQWASVFRWINMDTRAWNFYHSLAVYKEGIPDQTFSMEKRDNTAWNKDHWRNIDKFDFLIDFDCESHADIHYSKGDVLRVSALLNQVPHSVRYSGMGYHIVIPGDYMPKLTYDPDADNNYFDMLYDLLAALKRKYSDFIDTGCHDPRRIVKMPYSLALYDDDNYVCWPMRTLKEMDMQPINFLSGAVLHDFEPIQNRGIPLLNMEKDINKSVFAGLLGSKAKKYGIKK